MTRSFVDSSKYYHCTMDQSSYKDVTTTRGLKYHYFFSPATASLPTLLFLHGFPSTSWDWRRIVPFFVTKGYGVIAPDMLGYGGTDKPTDPHAFKWSLMTKDIIDILDAESVHKAVVIGHDWGAGVTSRLSNYFPERFTAYAFLAVSYLSPSPGVDAAAASAYVKSLVGRELYGYWFFMAEDGADKIIEDNYERFQSIIYPEDPEEWKLSLNPSGATKEWLLTDKKPSLTIASYIPPEEAAQHRAVLLKGGFASPVCWYKVLVAGINGEDDKNIPLENYSPKAPVFFGASTKDQICLAAVGKASIAMKCKGVNTIKEYDADHWLILSHAEQLSADLLGWIEGL
ncbi:hypothetical protein PLICRDRAFT_35398 [Plicaturopsis crispa FD-325 SS-3]|nr:hypothetical protein PLICRDRAFT_35398 [Plicaturopsis crispa FD-325 SS-3]